MKNKWQYSRENDNDDDGSQQTTKRVIKGRLTPKRWALIYRYARKLDIGHIPTGSMYDCTGLHCGQRVETTFCQGAIILVKTDSFDF